MESHGKEDVELKNSKATTRWRGIKSISHNRLNDSNSVKKPVLQERESDLTAYDDVDISLIQTRTYLLSAGIGDTNKQYNKYKGKIGLVIWCFNIVIHFSLDFYEAWTIFGTSWATCIGLFLVTLVVCCISMIKYSIPWFLRGVRKLKKDGHYPKTLSRVRLLVRFMPFGTVVFAIGAAAGQFGCYAADNALRVNFNTNGTIVVPQEVEILFNVLRATSLIHIFYGFASLLLFHMTLIFMVQSSMKEYNDRMGKLFREVPITIQFSEAVNLFSARAKFVRDGSKHSSIVLTTLLVACCTSFVLNAYNFLFLAKHAIYIWFALAPLIWAVTPLMGAAWITKTYWQYKLVVVNAWVDIPDEHELEAGAHAALHRPLLDDKPAKVPGKSLWGAVMKDVAQRKGEEDVQKSHDDTASNKDAGLNERSKGDLPRVIRSGDGDESKKISTLLRRRSSDGLLNTSPKPAIKAKRSSSSLGLSSISTPTIMFSDYDHENSKNASQKKFRLALFTRKVSDSSLSDKIPKQGVLVGIRKNQSVAGAESHVPELRSRRQNKDVCIDIDPPQERELSQRGLQTHQHGSISSLSGSLSSSSSSERLHKEHEGPEFDGTKPEGSYANEKNSEVHIHGGPSITNKGSSVSTLDVPGGSNNNDSKPKGPNLLSGISKTFHQWRTKTKKKKRFNYEKYIIYLESILPTVGFSIGGVLIDWNGIYTFIVVMTFMVGVFAQEAFFGT